MRSPITKINSRYLIIDSDTTLENATLIVKDGVIVEHGPSESLAKVKTDRTINLKNHILHPGFINAHSHLELSFLKDKLHWGAPFTDWAVELVQQRKKATNAQMRKATKVAVDRMIQTGTTLVGDITFTGAVGAPLIRSGIKAVVFHEMLGYRPGVAEESFRSFLKRIKAAPSSGLVVNAVSPHAVFSTSSELIKKGSTYSTRRKMPITMHLCETPEEIEFSRKGTGPLRELLIRYNAFQPGRYPKSAPVHAVDKVGGLDNLLVAHLNLPAPGDLNKLKKANAKVVVCPNCGHWFNRGMKTPIYSMLDKGITVAIGTDSLASNYDLDMGKEMTQLMKFFPDLSRKTVFHMATRGGAAALRESNGAGTLHDGSDFDAVAVRVGASKRVDLFKAVMGPRRITDKVWVAGNLRYRNKEK